VTASFITANILSVGFVLMTVEFANPQQDVVYARIPTLLDITVITARTTAAAAA